MRGARSHIRGEYSLKPASVLIIGSGPIVIGQAAEFDYAGTQACQALREEGVRSVLVNSNPATIMTDQDVADAVYIEPLTVGVRWSAIIAARAAGRPAADARRADRPEPGRRAREAGILERYDVRLLGTPLETIRTAEDRELFSDLLSRNRRAGAGERDRARRCEQCVALAEQIGLPRHHPAGLHAGRHRRRHGVHARSELRARSPRSGLAASPITRCWSSRTCSAGKRSSTR